MGIYEDTIAGGLKSVNEKLAAINAQIATTQEYLSKLISQRTELQSDADKFLGAKTAISETVK